MVTHAHDKNRDLIPHSLEAKHACTLYCCARADAHTLRQGVGPTPGQVTNSLFLHVKAAATRTAAAGARDKAVALGFTARPKAGGQLMMNPNTASGQAVIVRRGKERAGGKKKRVSTLKKIILRERAAKEAARAAAGLAPAKEAAEASHIAEATSAAADGGISEQQQQEDGEEEDQGDAIVLHVARDHVYISLEACLDGNVRVHMLPVEAHDDDDDDDEDSGSDGDSCASSAWSEAHADDSASFQSESDASEPELEVGGHDAAVAAGPSIDVDTIAADVGPVGALRVEAAPFVPFVGRMHAALDVSVTACALCGVQCGTLLVLDQHMRGKAHARRVRAAAAQAQREKQSEAAVQGGGASTADGKSGPAPQQPSRPDCRYGRQVVTPALNGAVAALLTRLLELQARLRAREPLKAKARQRLVFGLRECAKALRTRRAKALVVAPNVEQISAPGGLDDAVDALLTTARAAGVPVVLALTRSRMGALTGRRVKMSAACVLDASGCEDAFKGVLRMAEEAAQQWERAHPDAEPLPHVAHASLAVQDTPLLLLRRDGRQRPLRPGEEAPAAAARQLSKLAAG